MIKAAVCLTEEKMGEVTVRAFILYEYHPTENRVTVALVKEVNVPLDDGSGRYITARSKVADKHVIIHDNISCSDFLEEMGRFHKKGELAAIAEGDK